MRMTCLLLALAVAAAAAQAPPPAEPPNADEKRAIESRLTELTARIASLAARNTDPALVADVAIYRKAAEYILRFPEEFATRAFVANTLGGA